MPDRSHEHVRGHLDQLATALGERGVETHIETHLVIPPSLAVLGGGHTAFGIRAGLDGCFWLTSEYQLGPVTDTSAIAARVAKMLGTEEE